MSLDCHFSYCVPKLSDGETVTDTMEVQEVYTQYLNWMFELEPQDYKRVNGFAPFLEDVFGDDQFPLQSQPFQPEQARLWATRWLELWQADTKDKDVEAAKRNWSSYTNETISALHQVVEQAECARRHGVLLTFQMG